MKNIISEVHRMKVLAGLINESNENIKDQIQVWFDLDGVLADMEGSLQKNEELIRLKAELDKVVKEKFSDWASLTNDELKEKFKVAIDVIQSKVPAWGKLGVEDLKNRLAQDPENKDFIHNSINKFNYGFKVNGYPTLIIYKNGLFNQVYNGNRNAKEIINKLNNLKKNN